MVAYWLLRHCWFVRLWGRLTLRLLLGDGARPSRCQQKIVCPLLFGHDRKRSKWPIRTIRGAWLLGRLLQNFEDLLRWFSFQFDLLNRHWRLFGCFGFCLFNWLRRCFHSHGSDDSGGLNWLLLFLRANDQTSEISDSDSTWLRISLPWRL